MHDSRAAAPLYEKLADVNLTPADISIAADTAFK